MNVEFNNFNIVIKFHNIIYHYSDDDYDIFLQ